MTTPREILLEAARAIRPYLTELLDPQVAADIDSLLAQQLAAADKTNAEDAIRRTLLSQRPTADWWAAFLEHGVPPEVLPAMIRLNELPGDGQNVAAARYICPYSDFVWYRISVGVAVPSCPTHGLRLRLRGAP